MIFVDLDSLRPQSQGEPNSSLPLLTAIKRGSTLVLPVQFVSQGIVVELSAGATGSLGFKQKGNHNAASYAAVAMAWVKTGTGTAAVYTFTVTFLNAALNALFVIGDTAAADEIGYIDLVGEIKWTDANGTHESGPDFPLRVLNDVNQGGEVVPTFATAGILTLLSSVTQLTGNVVVNGVAQSLDAVPTAGVYGLSSLLFARITGLSAFTFDLGAADVTDPGQVAPHDYNALTNNFHWTKRF